MLSDRQKFVKKIALSLAILFFLLLFAVDIFFVPPAGSTQISQTQTDTRISSNLSPRIDGEAAMVVKEDGRITSVCQTLPPELWIFLLTAYLFLLLFNLFFDFEKSNKIHWFWEGFYALLALGAWHFYDACRQNLWFPLYVLKLGIIVYLVYLYLFYKKKEIRLFPENGDGK